ncbi:hypothetical protein M2401_001024 [Pseudomonas sp. JUb42]|uniref:hypothetical protein n=1 Tax=Pseudomonas sp. JUb42 TaxID=2940611 RepID=UPI0021676C50|nr:hypothetical protein [Pseudomonas sp. JUb42]MCS3467303.1 hypothetical protein [Pseudomonas sp. JUb42]
MEDLAINSQAMTLPPDSGLSARDFYPLNRQSDLGNIIQDIDNQGFACLENVITANELNELVAFADTSAQRYQGEYFALHGKDLLNRSLLAKLWDNPNLVQMLSRLYEHAAGRKPASDTIWPVLRCVQGNQGERESGCFHYDASLVTLLIPIIIPSEGEERGDLMVFANIRKTRGMVLFNLIEKMLLQNSFSRKLLNAMIKHKLLKPRQLQLKPGNLYIFWGYRSLHANKPCSPDIKRATAIFHFGDPHEGSAVTKLILKFNQRRARRTSHKAMKTPRTQ